MTRKTEKASKTNGDTGAIRETKRRWAARLAKLREGGTRKPPAKPVNEKAAKVDAVSVVLREQTTFAALHATRQTQDALHEVDELTCDFRNLAESIIYGLADDKGGALRALAAEYIDLVEEALDDIVEDVAESVSMGEVGARATHGRKPFFRRAIERLPLGEVLTKIDKRYGLSQDDDDNEVVSERPDEVVQISGRGKRASLKERFDQIDAKYLFR